MSSMRLSSHPVRRTSARRPEDYARGFGQFIQIARRGDGRPLEELAPLAGLTVPEWEEIEGGRIPDTWEQVCLIAQVLHLGRSWMPYLTRRYAGAWQK
jgi:Helix-turn-helix domain